MADGSVKIDVGLNIGKAERELAKLRDKINKTEDQLNANSSRKTELEKQIEQVGFQADRAKEKVRELKQRLGETRSRDEKATIREQLAEATEEQRLMQQQLNQADSEYIKINKSIEQGTVDLREMKEQAGEMSHQIAAARPGEMIADSLKNAKRAMMTFLKYALGIRSLFFLFRRLRNSIKESVTAFAEGDEETKNTINGLKSALADLKVSWGAAFAPILNAVAPLLQTLIGYLISAANAISRFIAIVSGRTSFKKVATGMQKVADAAGGAAQGIAEVKRQLMGFDELNVLNGNDSGGGGGGGGGGSDFDTVEEAIDAFDGSFLNNLALSVKDVLFDWHDLNPEQIAEKMLAGLAAALGLALGISLGLGPGGVILMTLAGLVVGLVFDALIFDHDGKLDKSELVDMLLVVLNGIVGGIVGFMFTKTFKGAMIGASIATGLTLLYKAIDMKTDGALSKNGIAGGLTALLAGVLGLQVGKTIFAGSAIAGPAGALIGIVVGIGLTLIIQSVKARAAARDAFYDTDFGKSVQELKEKLQETLQADADLRVRINSITGEIDENTMADLAAAQDLINRIFTLDAKENKTSAEAELLKQQIEALNGLGLPGLQIAFDETTGHVTATRQEIQGMYDDLLRQYQIEAMKDAYIESFKAQYDSTENVRRATEEATTATGDYQTALSNLEAAQNEYSDAVAAKIEDNSKANRQRLEDAKAALIAAEEAVTSTKANAETAKETLETALETADLATEKVEGIGDALTNLVTEGAESGKNTAEGFSQGITENAPLSAEETRKMGEAAIQALADVLDAHSPSRKTEEQGKNAIDGFKNAIEQGTPEVVSAVEKMGDEIVAALSKTVDRMRQLMNFSWEIPRPRIPVIGARINTVQYGPGMSLTLPEFFVNWYAKGGIFDMPSLIGVGENGKEAVVPLEKNTEWMTTVAEGLMDRLTKADFANRLADAFMSVPKPAMANGTILPPNAYQTGFGGGEGASILQELRELRDAILNQPIQLNSKMYLDKRQVGQSVTEFQRNDMRSRGV